MRDLVHQPARLLFVYFLNDRFEGKRCPPSVAPWARHLARMYDDMGIPFEHNFKSFVHYLCLDVTNGQRYPLTMRDADSAE